MVQLIYRSTTKTLLAQSWDKLWACMLHGKAYDCNMIECLVSNELYVTKDMKAKKTWKQKYSIICTCYKGNC